MESQEPTNEFDDQHDHNQKESVTFSKPESFRQSRMKSYRKVVRWMWRLYLLGLITVITMFVWLSYQLPSFKQLEDPKSRIASVVYASNMDDAKGENEILGKYYVENRTIVPYDSLSPHLVNALVATEDARFYEHSGIDAYALGRVFVKTMILQQRNAGGGSTISQQLAKLLVGRPNTKGRNKLVRFWMIGTTKLKEWLTAVKLERSYTKKEIISMYFNEFDFLFNANGVRSAAETYFQKTPKELSINEAAMLVRMLKNPSLYNPILNPKNAKKGREQVLKNMQIHKHITQEQYDKLRVEPIDITRFKMVNHNDGVATHFREYLRGHLKKLLKQENLLQSDGKPYDLYRDGLKIYTTIDARYQRHAEKAVWDHLSQHQKKLFKHWPNWNNKADRKYKNRNPWTYKDYRVSEGELALRRWALERVVWGTDRYKIMRNRVLPTVVKLKLRDSDIYRMNEMERANKRKKKHKWDKVTRGEDLLKYWLKMEYIDQDKANILKKVMASADWEQIKKEYKAMFDYFEQPVKMRIFAYNQKGETDTIMSPMDSIRYHRMHLQTGSISIDTKNGHIKSWVGGLNHKYFKYDHANKRNARQVGSTMKPFLYAVTIEKKGLSPCQEVWDVKTTIEKGYGKFGLHKDWTPKNAGGSYSGQTLTLISALTKSLNSVSAYLMKELNSPEPLRKTLADAGIDTSKVPSNPTICLGTADLSVYEMVGAYSVFANLGVYNEPVFIERIEDADGNVIYVAEQDQDTRQALDKRTAYVMSQVLQRVQSTAGGFGGIKSKHGGKTGTTNFQADGWFMGIIPGLAVGTWVGCDDRFIRFRTLTNGQGAHMARPIFQNFLRNIEGDPVLAINTKAEFPKLDDMDAESTQNSIELNCGKINSGGLADEFPDLTNPIIDEYDDSETEIDVGDDSE
ncbi:MAG: penicillin-binding protein [Saprospiraceae bacterium]|nr:penicillin-binding protein [Saprospiraceae bacterium]